MPTPWGIIVALFAFYYHRTVLQTEQKKDSGLSPSEKLPVIVSCFFEPLWSGLIYYLGWREKYPNKANEAAKWAIALFIFGSVMMMVFIIAGAWYLWATGFALE